ncbi:MAG: hypothetical protein NTW86_27015 [Candidatus Sumerlaeota bacterium]|nr:hypothetical protein [Candidatus Sumerlaeota bacterium]
MDPKKIAILIVLLIGLVFAGRWTCQKWKMYHPQPRGGAYGYGYGYAKKGAPGTPGGAQATPAAPTAPATPAASAAPATPAAPAPTPAQ